MKELVIGVGCEGKRNLQLGEKKKLAEEREILAVVPFDVRWSTDGYSDLWWIRQ